MVANQETPGPVVAKEIAYPSAGGPQASDANQISWYHNYAYAAANQVAGEPFYFVYFEAYDQPWKSSDAYEPHMGLNALNNPDGSSQPKPAVAQLQADIMSVYPGTNVPPYASKQGLALTETPGVPFTANVAEFTDPNDPIGSNNDVYSASILWGDGGGFEKANLSISNGTIIVSASHTYSAPGQYTVQVALQRSSGYGEVVQTQVSVTLPAVTTRAATAITTTGATLNATVNPEGSATTFKFVYGKNRTLTTGTTTTTVQSAGSGTGAQSETAVLTGLTQDTTYYFEVQATNASGTTTGAILNFTTAVTVPLVASVGIVPSVPFPTYGQALTFTATVSPASSGGPTPKGTVQFRVDGVNLGPAVTLVSGAATSIATSTLGAGTHKVTAVYSGDNTYAGNTGSIGLTVAKAPLTVTAVNKSKVYGAGVPNLTYTITGFVNGDTVKVISGVPKLTTSATTSSGVGTYPITVAKGTLSAANYNFNNLVNGKLTVTKAQLTVTAVNKTKTQGAANPALTYTITGFVNGDKPTVVQGKPALSTTAVKTSPAGKYPIIVSLGTLSASNYDFSLVNGTLTVTGAKASAFGVAVAQVPDSEASPSPFDRLIPRWWRKGHGLSRNS